VELRSLLQELLDKYVAEIRSPRTFGLRSLLQPVKLRNPASQSQVGCPFTAVAGSMDEGEVVLLVEALVGERRDMIDFQLVEHGVDGFVTDEALPALQFQEPALERRTSLAVEAC
jgi:hypothetical protein